MRVLVTGSAGHIGSAVVEDLESRGHVVRTFDRVGAPHTSTREHRVGDICDILSVRQAVPGVDAVVHLAAHAHDHRGAEDQVLASNVQGTWNVLLACKEAGVPRVVYMSSINSLGNFGGHRSAAYLPIDDDYPHHPQTPYQMGKHLAEELCRMFADAYGLVTLCLRPVMVAFPDNYARWREYRGPWRKEWGRGDYWAYVDVRDVCEAVARCLDVQGHSHACMILSAPDITMVVPTAELVAEYYPDTPWKVDKEAYFASDPFRALLDCSRAEEVLGWKPSRTWRKE